MTELIVFSRDRACQLDALLASLYESYSNEPMPGSPTVLWTASDDDFGIAYEMCIEDHRGWVDFVEESDFRADVEQLIPDEGLVCFFTDDDVLHRRVNLADAARVMEIESVIAFSLRLGVNTTHCYPLDQEQECPACDPRSDGTMTWWWARAAGDYGYPMSVDGHVMRAADVHMLLGLEHYANPNEFEQLLAVGAGRIADRCPLLASYQHSALTGIPANRVNQTHPNRFGVKHAISAGELNTRYLAGERIDLAALDFGNVVGAHQEIELVLA